MPFFNDTSHTIAEITRRLDNLLRIGVVEKLITAPLDAVLKQVA